LSNKLLFLGDEMNLWSLIVAAHKLSCSLIGERKTVVARVNTIHVHWEAIVIVLTILHKWVELFKILIVHGWVGLILISGIILRIISLRL